MIENSTSKILTWFVETSQSTYVTSEEFILALNNRGILWCSSVASILTSLFMVVLASSPDSGRFTFSCCYAILAIFVFISARPCYDIYFEDPRLRRMIKEWECWKTEYLKFFNQDPLVALDHLDLRHKTESRLRSVYHEISTKNLEGLYGTKELTAMQRCAKRIGAFVAYSPD